MLSCSYSTRWMVIGQVSRPAVGCSYVAVFPGVFPYGRHPRFRDFDPVVPVDVVRVEVDLDRFLDSASEPVSSLSMHLTLFQLGPCLVLLVCSATYRSDSALGVHLSRAASLGVPVQERMKEHERDVHLAHYQTSAVAEHANANGQWPKLEWCHMHWQRSTLAHLPSQGDPDPPPPQQHQQDNGIEIPEAWMPTIWKHSWEHSDIGTSNQRVTHSPNHHPVGAIWAAQHQVYIRLMKTSSS